MSTVRPFELPAVSLGTLLRWIPVGLLGLLLVGFAALSQRFLTPQNLASILTQSSWLIVLGLGMNFVLLTAGVDLSVGAAMYLSALTVAVGLSHAPVWMCVVLAMLVGGACGAVNALLVVLVGIPAFIATLATSFVGRGLGLFLSSTRIEYAAPPVAAFGRSLLIGVPLSLWSAAIVTLLVWLLFQRTSFGSYVRTLGFDPEGARRVGVPTVAIRSSVYVLCGAFAGLAGFISLSQTAAASSAFGSNSEFLAIAAAVLGGTSLFGGRGSIWAPLIGAVLIMTIQNGLVLIDANPYAYPVITGAVIFLAALLDSLRLHLQARLGRQSR